MQLFMLFLSDNHFPKKEGLGALSIYGSLHACVISSMFNTFIASFPGHIDHCFQKNCCIDKKAS